MRKLPCSIRFHLSVPEDYDGSRPYALFLTLPGWEGLYFQGVGENLRWEKFGQEAANYHADMIVVAPQLSDWGETSARETIALTEYFLTHYNIDQGRVYINSLSGGGETLSHVLGMRPELVVLDVKSHDYFASRGQTNQHGGAVRFAYDEAIMGWLFGHGLPWEQSEVRPGTSEDTLSTAARLPEGAVRGLSDGPGRQLHAGG